MKRLKKPVLRSPRLRESALLLALWLLASLAACQPGPPTAGLMPTSATVSPGTLATKAIQATMPPATETVVPASVGPTRTRAPSASPPASSATPTAAVSPFLATHQPAIVLSDGPHLFIDDYLIASRSNVTRVVNPAQRIDDEPVIDGLQPGSNFNNINFSTDAIFDTDLGLFRMWYWAYDPLTKQRYTAHTQSADGLHWQSPPYRVPGTLDNMFVAVLDLRATATNPNESFIAISSSLLPPHWLGRILLSRDGLQWTSFKDTPIFPQQYGEMWRPFINAHTGQYGILHRWNKPYSWQDVEGKQHENTAHDPSFVRLYAYSSTPDLKVYTEPELIFVPDELDSGETQFYNLSNVVRRGDYYLAMLDILRDDLTASELPATFYSPVMDETFPVYGMGYTVLAWSRDGVHWQRDREADPFFEPNPQPESWDHAMAWISSMVQVGDWEYLYYGGYQYGHKVYADRQIGLARVKRDRFVAQMAGSELGALRTVPLVSEATSLTLNVDAALGVVKVQILDAEGTPIPGYTYGECQPITVDNLEVPVECAADFGQLAGQTIQLEFYLINTRLFGFSLL